MLPFQKDHCKLFIYIETLRCLEIVEYFDVGVVDTATELTGKHGDAHSGQVAFAVGGSHWKGQLVTDTHLGSLSGPAWKRHTQKHTHAHTQYLSVSTFPLVAHIHDDTEGEKHTHSHTLNIQTLSTDSVQDQNEARRDLAERHGMFHRSIDR